VLGIVICPFDVTLLKPDCESAGSERLLAISYLLPYHVRPRDLHFNPPLSICLDLQDDLSKKASRIPRTAR
jgi:hypothetical protein